MKVENMRVTGSKKITSSNQKGDKHNFQISLEKTGCKITISSVDPIVGMGKVNEYFDVDFLSVQKTLVAPTPAPKVTKDQATLTGKKKTEFDKAFEKLKDPKTPGAAEKNAEIVTERAKKAVQVKVKK